MPMPSSARITNRKVKLGEKPASKLQIEYQRIEIISGARRPSRSASQPDAVAPPRRMISVIEKIAVTSISGTWKYCAIGAMIKRKTVKSKASSVHPIQAAQYAYHWSFVGSFHHGRLATSLAYPDIDLNSLLCSLPVGWAYVCPFRSEPISELKPDAISPKLMLVILLSPGPRAMRQGVCNPFADRPCVNKLLAAPRLRLKVESIAASAKWNCGVRSRR